MLFKLLIFLMCNFVISQPQPQHGETFDWSTGVGTPEYTIAVTNVKDQGQCTRCQTFAFVGAVEGQYKLTIRPGINSYRDNELKSFSEQQIFDALPGNCTYRPDNYYDLMTEYIKTNKLAESTCYPWIGDKSWMSAYYNTFCPKTQTSGNSDMYSCLNKPSSSLYINSAAQLIQLINTGPVYIGIYQPLSWTTADPKNKKIYGYNSGSGVYDDDDCNVESIETGKKTNHALLFVGYGVWPDDGSLSAGKSYFKFKNSYGSAIWGYSGYGYIAQTMWGEDECGPCNIYSYVIKIT